MWVILFIGIIACSCLYKIGRMWTTLSWRQQICPSRCGCKKLPWYDIFLLVILRLQESHLLTSCSPPNLSLICSQIKNMTLLLMYVQRAREMVHFNDVHHRGYVKEFVEREYPRKKLGPAGNRTQLVEKWKVVGSIPSWSQIISGIFSLNKKRWYIFPCNLL